MRFSFNPLKYVFALSLMGACWTAWEGDVFATVVLAVNTYFCAYSMNIHWRNRQEEQTTEELGQDLLKMMKDQAKERKEEYKENRKDDNDPWEY